MKIVLKLILDLSICMWYIYIRNKKEQHFRRYNMNLHYDKKTGRANEIIEKEVSNTYRETIEKIVNYLSLEVFKYNRTIREVPNDVFDKAHQFIEEVRDDFINNVLMYDFSNEYINLFDCKAIYKSFNEAIGQLEDIYLYKTIYKKSNYHYCD